MTTAGVHEATRERGDVIAILTKLTARTGADACTVVGYLAGRISGNKGYETAYC
jgi:hypothetical protein